MGVEFLFGEDRHLQFSGLLQLASRFFAGNEERGLLADASRRFAAEGQDQFFDLVALVLLQAAGDDYGHTCEGLVRGLGDFHPRVDADALKLLHRIEAGGVVEEVMDAFGDDVADVVDRGEFRFARGGQRIHGAEVVRQQIGDAIADVADI